jgi:TonB-dependent starch-binding outer membrane protein SusC
MKPKTIIPNWQVLAISYFCALLFSGCIGSDRSRNVETPVAIQDTTNSNRSIVDANELDDIPNANIAQMLMGRFPGVMVQETGGGGISVRIRGGNAMGMGQEPLYIVDGIAVQVGSDGVLPINVRDIESIEVLKGAAESAVYGIRGANGVIVIKTKRGR